MPSWFVMFHLYVDRTNCGHVFYVGKGNDGRVKSKKRNPLHDRIRRHYGLTRSIVHSSHDEALILELEVFFIALYKTNICRHRNNPFATNMTDGGDGIAGHVHSDKSRAQMSASKQVTHNTAEVKANLSRASTEAMNRPEVRAYQSIVQKQASKRPEVIEHRSAAQSIAQARPETRQKKSVSRKAAALRPEVFENCSQGLKTAFAEPEKYKNLVVGAHNRNRPASRDDTSKQKSSLSITKAYEINPELRKNKYQKHSSTERIIEEGKQIQARIANGEALGKIATDYGVIGSGTFSRILRRYGLYKLKEKVQSPPAR